jgi:Ca2+/H+ antiporter
MANEREASRVPSDERARTVIKALTPAVKQVGIPKAFAGLVIVAIAGSAARRLSRT